MLGPDVLSGKYLLLAKQTLACWGFGLAGFAVRILQVLAHLSVVGKRVLALHFLHLYLSVSLDSYVVSDFAWTFKNQNCKLSLVCLHGKLASYCFDPQFQNLNLKFS